MQLEQPVPRLKWDILTFLNFYIFQLILYTESKQNDLQLNDHMHPYMI